MDGIITERSGMWRAAVPGRRGSAAPLRRPADRSPMDFRLTEDQVLLTRAIDPPIATSSCDNGSAEIIGLDVQDFGQQFVSAQTSAVVSPLFASGGAVYATTLEGNVVRIGTPTTPDATVITPVTPPPPTSTPPVKRRTWRQLLD